MTKHIIDGKRYDTETSTLIGEASYGNYGDFAYWEETLYRTKKGAYFVVGEGGALSAYAVRLSQNSTGGGSGARSLTPQEALEWAERYHVDAETIAAHFSALIEEA